MKKLLSLLLSAILAVSLIVGNLVSCTPVEEGETDPREASYTAAMALVNDGKYEAAYEAFKALGDYKDAQKQLERFVYFPTVMAYVFDDRSGVMTVTLGKHNLPQHLISDGLIGVKDGEYTFNDAGEMIKHVVLFNGVSLVYDYTYDENHNMIKAVYSEDGVEIAVHDYAYNENGDAIKQKYTENGVVYYDYNNSYDDNGNMIRSEYITEDASYVFTYTYNADGNKTNEQGVYSNGYSYNIDYTYDANGKRIREESTESEGDSYTVEYFYDNAGNCIKEECTYNDGGKEYFEREFDSHGNVTKEKYTDHEGNVQIVTTSYALTYLTIDVPQTTMKQVLDAFKLFEY